MCIYIGRGLNHYTLPFTPILHIPRTDGKKCRDVHLLSWVSLCQKKGMPFSSHGPWPRWSDLGSTEWFHAWARPHPHPLPMLWWEASKDVVPMPFLSGRSGRQGKIAKCIWKIHEELGGIKPITGVSIRMYVHIYICICIDWSWDKEPTIWYVGWSKHGIYPEKIQSEHEETNSKWNWGTNKIWTGNTSMYMCIYK